MMPLAKPGVTASDLPLFSCPWHAAPWSVHPIVTTALRHHAGTQYDKKASPWFGIWLSAADFFDGCATQQERRLKHAREHAFISYWPATLQTKGLRLAVKDNIDMKGRVTSAGSEYLAKNKPPAVRDAACLALARERNVQIVGKTNLTEFAVTVSGQNHYYGTPKSRLNGKDEVIPGGSSSGSAVAVATHMADVAFGSDTGGSIRVPAACNGVYGLKTTFGLVSTKGVFPISPKHLDTVVYKMTGMNGA